MHPRAHLERFVTAYRRAGGELKLRLHPNEVEGFVTKKPDSTATEEATRAMVCFVRQRCDEVSKGQ